MVHPDYESFQIPADVQEEYRKLVVQKRVVKWADGNEYDAEIVDAAIESGEISTTLTAQEIERLKQILWAKAYEEPGAKWRFDIPFGYHEDLTYADFNLTEAQLTEFISDVNSFLDEYGTEGEYELGDSTEGDTALVALVSVNGMINFIGNSEMSGLHVGYYCADAEDIAKEKLDCRLLGAPDGSEFGDQYSIYDSTFDVDTKPFLTYADLGYPSEEIFNAERERIFNSTVQELNGAVVSNTTGPYTPTFGDNKVIVFFTENVSAGLILQIPSAEYLAQWRIDNNAPADAVAVLDKDTPAL